MRWPVLVIVCACAAPAAQPPRAQVDARPAWDALVHALPGRWIATTGASSVPVRFELIAGGTVVLETFGRPGKETATAYHLDGSSLVATHYCAQGNQPRLRLHDGDARHPRLTFADVTGQDAGEAVLVELAYDLSAAGGFDRVEVYRQPDGSLERTAWHYAPAP